MILSLSWFCFSKFLIWTMCDCNVVFIFRIVSCLNSANFVFSTALSVRSFLEFSQAVNCKLFCFVKIWRWTRRSRSIFVRHLFLEWFVWGWWEFLDEFGFSFGGAGVPWQIVTFVRRTSRSFARCSSSFSSSRIRCSCLLTIDWFWSRSDSAREWEQKNH